MKSAQTEPAPAIVLCSKCGANPRANGADSTNPWCKDCLAKYQKEYKEMWAKRNSEQAYVRGVNALRNMLTSEFNRLGSGMFSGFEIAVLISRAPLPSQTDAIID